MGNIRGCYSRDGEQWTDKGYVLVEPTGLDDCTNVGFRTEGAKGQAEVRDRRI